LTANEKDVMQRKRMAVYHVGIHCDTFPVYRLITATVIVLKGRVRRNNCHTDIILLKMRSHCSR